MTPVEYLNRIRIIKSLEYLERNQCNIADAAASVGIYDANYYTRLFKKILGYSPKYFKKHPVRKSKNAGTPQSGVPAFFVIVTYAGLF